MRKLTTLVLVAGCSFATGFAQAPQEPLTPQAPLPKNERKLEITFQGSNVTLRRRTSRCRRSSRNGRG